MWRDELLTLDSVSVRLTVRKHLLCKWINRYHFGAEMSWCSMLRAGGQIPDRSGPSWLRSPLARQVWEEGGGSWVMLREEPLCLWREAASPPCGTFWEVRKRVT